MTSDTVAAEPRLRADAARNRAKVLAAAREAFAAEGMGVDVAAIARRAGVGVGTVYRHFPTKDALLSALRAEHFERLAEIVQSAIDEGGTPWEQLERMVWRSAEYTAGDQAMCEVLTQAPVVPGGLPEARRLQALSSSVARAARESGAARPDLRDDDIGMMMCAFGRIATVEHLGGPFSWRRYLEVMLDGLRAR